MSVFDVSRFGLGCMALTGIYGNISQQEAISVIHHALDLGVQHFDTAELYGPYENETLLGKVFGKGHSEVKIATKFGYKLVAGKICGLDSHPLSIRNAVEGSLRRLRRDRIDLLYQHRVDPNIPIEEVVGIMSDLVKEGKVKELGLSNVNSSLLKRADSIHTIHAVQNEYSLIQRDSENSVFPFLDEVDTMFVSFSPLGRGILCGNTQGASLRETGDYRTSDVRFQDKQLIKIISELRPLWEVSQEREVPPSVIALAWILAQNDKAIIIPGAKNIEQVTTNTKAISLQLTANELDRLSLINAANLE